VRGEGAKRRIGVGAMSDMAKNDYTKYLTFDFPKEQFYLSFFRLIPDCVCYYS